MESEYLNNTEEQSDICEDNGINTYQLISEQIMQFDEYIDHLWDNVMLRYIESNDNVVLKGLTKYDKHKFYHFMLNQIKKTHVIKLEEST